MADRNGYIEWIGITEPCYTQCPNAYFDYWQNKLKPTEFSVLMAITRKTFGWVDKSGDRKLKDKISISQLTEATGLSKHTVIEGLRGLRKNNIVRVNKYGTKINEIEIVMRRSDLRAALEQEEEDRLVQNLHKH
jgi:predicted transcriptional regulator